MQGAYIYQDPNNPNQFIQANENTVVGYDGVELIMENAPHSYSSQLFLGFTVHAITPTNLKFTFSTLGIPGFQNTLQISPYLYNKLFDLPWYNCFSFGNGVESDRVRDSFNLPQILNGVKASTTLETEYKEERRLYGLIYSGIYNSNSGLNNLNQFIQAEKITKDINPIYGSIQKLHARNSDLVTLCEDKVLKILAQKDALFNADGNTNVTATENVLGQTIPFSGEYGISTNPESFASEAYRAYFTDKVRGSVLRLSMDGLTPISDAGMSDWFKDNLKLVPPNRKIIGSYDDNKNEYNVKLEIEETKQGITGEGVPGIITSYNPKVVTFKERIKGWVSFKSFIEMQNAVSMGNDYYTFYQGDVYVHHDDTVDRNTFYGTFTESSVDVMLNENPGIIKNFNTLNYEGSQGKIDKYKQQNLFGTTNDFQPLTTFDDQQFYNVNDVDGWYVKDIITDKEQGKIEEFIEKEGKWFNGISRFINTNINPDTSDFTFQGIGFANEVEATEPAVITCPVVGVTFVPSSTIGQGSLSFDIPPPDPNDPLGGYVLYNWTLSHPNMPTQTGGNNTTPTVTNSNLVTNGTGIYNFTVDFVWNANTSCTATSSVNIKTGCVINPNSPNYDSAVQIDDGSCIAPAITGCTDPAANNYNPAATVDDGSCAYSSDDGGGPVGSPPPQDEGEETTDRTTREETIVPTRIPTRIETDIARPSRTTRRTTRRTSGY